MRPPLAAQSIAVLLGGPSAEHDVSLVSGRAIAAALRGRGHRVEGWLIDLDRAWWKLAEAAMDETLAAPAYDVPPGVGAIGPYAAGEAVGLLASAPTPPVVFPALHGPFGEDGTVQALLESADLAYCGSGVAASAIGMDKALFKRLCGGLGVRVATWIDVSAGEYAADERATIARVEAFAASLGDPRVVVKPARLGSSIGVSIVHRPDEPPELEQAIALAFRYDDLLLVEAYLAGARELEASVVGNGRDDVAVYGPGEILPGREFYDYDAKYRSSASRTIVAPDLPPDVRDEVRRLAREVYIAVGASGFARVDFLLPPDGLPVVSEINTIPGFTPISLFPRLCAEGGHDFADVCERIVELALLRARGRTRPRLTRADLP